MPSQFTIYRSTDASAPVLSGTAGTLTTLLDAVLVTGYGAVSPAGWSIAYTAANKRVYQQGVGSSGCYYRVRDDGGGTGGAREALIYGAEAMTGIDTVAASVVRFPTTAQSSITDNALVIRKSSALSATARVWIAFADSRTCYLFIQDGDVASVYKPYMIGDVYTLGSSPYRAALICKTTENTSTPCYLNHYAWCLGVISVSGQIGHFLQRNYTGFGSSVAFSKVCNVQWTRASLVSSYDYVPVQGGINYPNGPDGSLWLCQAYLIDPSTSAAPCVFGTLRGIWPAAQPWTSFTDGDMLAGTGQLYGKSFMAVKGLDGSATVYGLFVETSATVDTN